MCATVSFIKLNAYIIRIRHGGCKGPHYSDSLGDGRKRGRGHVLKQNPIQILRRNT